ncbi:MAG: DNA cytosine methyltransferase [Pseudomonadota bacterium]
MFQKRLPLADELVVDNFAGGGGASIGIERGIGRAIDVAINHDPVAIAMHQANHPNTVHYAESVWDVDPLEACKGPVGLAWFSPDCTHFSRARGGVPVKKQIRGLAWVVLRWAATVKPRVIMLENVPEFAQWGPLTRKRGRTKHPRPCKFRTGSTFEQWRAQLEALGYETDTRELVACDYGAPTIRKRFFLIARRDGLPIVWPEPTHGPGLLPFRTAAECIDWSIPCPSIFERKRPLAEATMRRIAVGIKRYVLDSPQPFIVPICHTKGGNQPSPLSEPLRTITTARGGEMALVAPSLIQTGYGERRGQAPRSLNLGKPLGTVVAGGSKHGLVATFLAKHFGGNESPGWPLDKPISTVTSVDHHAIVSSHLVHLRRNCAARSVEDPAPTLTAGGNHLGEVRAFLLKYYGTAIGTPLGEPMHSTTSKGRFGLVTVHGEDYQIVDIGMRMLQPRELFNAQGFPSEYDIDVTMAQKPLTKAQKIKLCGNSVPPQWSEALVRANFAHERVNEAVA